MPPSLPSTGKGKQGERTEFEIMPTLKLVMDYSGLNFHEALALPCDLYMLMFKHATIDRLNQTEEGRDYLAKCERLKQTTPNIKALKERYKQQ